MAEFDSIIAELKREVADMLALWEGVGMRRVRVVDQLPGSPPVDITEQYADGLRKPANAVAEAEQI